MKLYSNDLSHNAFRVRFYCREKGLNIDIVNVDLMKGEQNNGEFEKINPR